MPRRSKNVNWFETWNRRSRLRSGTRALSALDIPSDEPPGFSKKRPVVLKDEPVDDGRPIPVKNDTDDEHSSPESAVGDTEEVQDEKNFDPEYLMFLNHIRADGRSFVLEMAVDGSPLVLKYEEDDDTSEVIQTQSPPKRGRRSGPREVRLPPGYKKPKRGDVSPNSSVTVETPCSNVSQSRAEGLMVDDEDYQMFLDRVREHDDTMVLEMDNGVVLKYAEEEEEVRPVEEVAVVQNDKGKKAENEGAPAQYAVKSEPIEYEDTEDVVEELPNGSEFLSKQDKLLSCQLDFPVSNSLVCAGDDSMECLTIKISTSYKERLDAALQEPFDQNEYDELLKLATNRGTIHKYKHLRGDSRSYPTKEPGRSYLDDHPDLAKRVECADYPMGLILLRGFFFWLKNLGHAGAFKPWKTLPYDSLEPVPLQVLGPNDSPLCNNCA